MSTRRDTSALIARMGKEEARRRAVSAQLLPGGETTALSVLRTVGVIQLDSLARVDRAHRLTCLARLPRNARAVELDATLWSRSSAVSFETYTHALTLIPVEDWPLFRLFRLAATRRKDAPSAVELHGVLDLVRDSDHGVTLRRIEEAAPKSGGWDWAEGKRAAEHLVWRGELVTTDRRLNRRIFDVPERRLSAELRENTLPRTEILAGLAERALRSLGVATAADVARHYSLSAADALFGLEHSTAQPIAIEGTEEMSWISPDAPELPAENPEPRFIGPFDPLIRDRHRARRLFDFDYTFEAYKPAAKRVYGHYVLGVLSGSRFLGRVDARREGSRLMVYAEFPEADASVSEFSQAVAGALDILAEQIEAEPVRLNAAS